jgi:hypothetical protein
MSIRSLKNDEKFSASFTYDPATKVATVVWSCRRSEKDPRYAFTSQLDFSNVGEADMAELASPTAIIALQRRWRVLANSNLENATTVNPFAKVNVKSAIVDVERKGFGPAKPPVERARKELAKVTDTAQINALIMELQGRLKATGKARKAA